jgi:nitrite reductase/ring-hydroxylating ferredoxin subunit
MNDEDRFERVIGKLLADRSPRSEMARLSEEEQRMVRMAQLLRGSRGHQMSPEFADRLHARLFSQKRRITRRAAFLSGLGALAAGIVAGLGLDRAVQSPSSTLQEPLVGANGRWYPVATLAELPDGTIRPFTAGAVQGFLIHRNGQLQALSRICTHMGCTLRINRAEQSFECPCHGAEFDLGGRRIVGRGEYHRTLPPLPPIMTRVKGETVEVFAA